MGTPSPTPSRLRIPRKTPPTTNKAVLPRRDGMSGCCNGSSGYSTPEAGGARRRRLPWPPRTVPPGLSRAVTLRRFREPDKPMTEPSTAEEQATPAAAEGGQQTAARDAIRERLGPVLSGSLRSKCVVIVGLGSGGSQTAEALVRSGVERLVLIDPESVEPANISRAVYVMGDVGSAKTEALQRRLREINPLVDCRLVATAVQDIPAADLDEIVSHADLVIGATDDPAAQRALNHFAFHRKIPAVFAGVYARGHGG